MTVRLVRQPKIAQIAQTASFDTITSIWSCAASIETTSHICLAALAAGVAPFVRVPANTPEYITRVLEGGALGVIAPHMASAAEARAVGRRRNSAVRGAVVRGRLHTAIIEVSRPRRRMPRSTPPPW